MSRTGPTLSRPRVFDLEPTVCTLCGSEYAVPFAKARDFEYETSDQAFHFVSCSVCQHVYMNPRPKLSEMPFLYPDHYYAYKRNEGFPSRWLTRIKTVIVKRRIGGLIEEVPENGTVLEIGCGDGTNLIAIKNSRPDLRLIGIDLHFAPHHREELSRAGIRLIERAFEEVTLQEQVDMIIMNQLIEHLWDIQQGVEKVSTMLKAGGRVSLSTPNIEGYDQAWFRDLWGGYHTPRHFNLFSKKSLSRLLQQNNLHVQHCLNLLAPLIWVTSVHNALKSKKSKWHGIFTYSNLPALALFCLLDLILLRTGKDTSNMQIVAVRK